MRTTYTKPNSHTQQQARKSVCVVETILQQADIDMDTWLGLMFESGCQYVEMGSDNEAFIKSELQDPEYDFWAWWLNFWISDDETLLKSGFTLSNGRYKRAKEQLMDYSKQQSDLRNEKVQNKA